jgi:hypothetical protein
MSHPITSVFTGCGEFPSSDAKVLPNHRSDSTFTTFDGNYPPEVTPRRG